MGCGRYCTPCWNIAVRPDGQSIWVLADGNHKLLRQEAGPVQGALDALGVDHVPIHGSAEGGNLVSDPSRNVLYWGVNNRNHMRELLMKGRAASARTGP